LARATWPPVHLPAANSARPCSGPSSWVPAQHDLQLWRRKSPSITKRPYERHGWDAKERSRRHLATDVVGRIVAGVLVAGPADTMGRLCPSCTFTLVGRQPGELGHYHDHIRYGRYRRNIFPRLPKLSRANQCRLQQSVEKRVFRTSRRRSGRAAGIGLEPFLLAWHFPAAPTATFVANHFPMRVCFPGPGRFVNAVSKRSSLGSATRPGRSNRISASASSPVKPLSVGVAVLSFQPVSASCLRALTYQTIRSASCQFIVLTVGSICWSLGVGAVLR